MSEQIRGGNAPDHSINGGAAVRLAGLGHRFGELEVIAGIDLELVPGEVLGLVGPSGCGKSTLLELISGLIDPPATGTVAVGGHEAPAERLERCAYMPQRDLLFPWLSALDNAALAARNRGLPRAAARAQAEPLLERFGLEGFSAAYPHELSGGMRQRIAFLRTLLAGKPVLLLDEPFASLDALTRAEMQEWLAAALEAEPRTTLLVSHDVEEALYLCDRVLILSARPGRIVLDLGTGSPRAADRTAAVTDPALVELRERALHALRGGAQT